MIPPDFFALLRCPATGQTLALAETELLARVNALPHRYLKEGGGPSQAVAPDGLLLDAALVRADQKVLYPIRDGIPVLLAEEAILL